MNIHFKKNVMLIITLVGVFVFSSLLAFYQVIRPSKFISEITPNNFGVRYEKIELITSDHVKLRGWFVPNGNPKAKTIILLHGYPADKGDILPSRIFLHKKYNLFFIDFRYLGESEGSYSTVGKDEVLDLLAAVQYCRERNLREIGVWGFSLGGAVALMAAVNALEIKAIVAESSYANLDSLAGEYYKIPILNYPFGKLLRLWGWLFLGYDIKHVSPVDSANQLNIPILLIHSKKDRVISFEQAKLFKEKLRNKKNIEFLWFDDLQHGQSFKGYEKTIENFFDKNLN
jgi:dipeptidyl aminopeptidase/acylaminoacyl peptidase